MSLDGLAQLLFRRGSLHEALELFRSAHETNSRVQGPEHEQSVVLLNSMGEHK